MRIVGARYQILIALALTVAIVPVGAPAPAGAAGPRSGAFSYDDYAVVLRTYVDDRGMVNYKGLKANREKLDAFVLAMAHLDPIVYGKWSEQEKVAFWINAYNALVLKNIIDHYPIKPSLFKLVVYPKHSIWHISGVWKKLKHPVMGRAMSLDEIEHETLRKDFNEPRLHVSIVCAAIGCPPLRNEPFTGERLEAQLDDQARRFLENPQNFRIDRDRRRVYLSSIFKWFGQDFVNPYGTEELYNGHGESAQAVLNFVSRYIGREDRDYLAMKPYIIHYTDYDWSLNEQREG